MIIARARSENERAFSRGRALSAYCYNRVALEWGIIPILGVSGVIRMNGQSSQKRIAVIGGGSWGTAFAALLGSLGHQVVIWAREPEVVAGINENKKNPLFNTSALLTGDVSATGEIGESLDGAQVAVVAVPSKFLTGMIEPLMENWQSDCAYLCLTKGLCGEPRDFISRFLKKEWPSLSEEKFAVLSGPNLATEVAAGYPTAAVVASRSEALASEIQAIAAGQNFRVYTSDDVLGVEVGGSAKNIIAIAAGVLDGLDLGVNARSVLITRGLVEMTRFAVKLGASPETLMGLSGLGDLVTTCSSVKSRNFTVGRRLAAGESLNEIESSMKMIAEGVNTARAVHGMARDLGCEMPIAEQVYLVVEKGKPISDAISDLMTREPKPEMMY
ncbi:NAD(P)-dependent glycerol-3-phosphate dehydrogenase [bacterium]|nr:NAD(P)-dependent glycerol-3-phosphate dehydrogenase [bacterium]